MVLFRRLMQLRPKRRKLLFFRRFYRLLRPCPTTKRVFSANGGTFAFALALPYRLRLLLLLAALRLSSRRDLRSLLPFPSPRGQRTSSTEDGTFAAAAEKPCISHLPLSFRTRGRHPPKCRRITTSSTHLTSPDHQTIMSKHAKDCRSSIIPSLRYRDALAAIDWLILAFGFERQAVYLGADKAVMHAQLTFGNGMVMLGSVPGPDDDSNPYSQLVAQPGETGLRSTQSACLIVDDADAVYATAKAAKADIVVDIADMPYGGRAFACRDPEGHLWNIGTYDPWIKS
jgi:uncharacterized glyoxalase superfamily protein PhnB